MEFLRLPRFKRAPAIVPIQLTERDRAIVRLIHRHRFLRSSHIISLIDGSPQNILRRLQLLFHHGFLDRPRVQIDYYYQSGSRQIVYGLGRKGISLLTQEAGPDSRSTKFEKNYDFPHRIFFEHAVLVSDIMVALELSCRKSDDIQLLTHVKQNTKWKVKMNSRVSTWIIPDRIFALESRKSPDRSPGLFFLEADRGTMPIVRKNLSQTSFYRKLLAYEATWSQGLHQSQFGFRRFRVLTVTTSAARVNSLLKACSKLKSGHGLFLFCDQTTFQKCNDTFTVPWKNVRQRQIRSILD